MTALARTFGLIPAAGKSTRMGRPKLALPLGDRTVLERVIAAVRGAGVAETLVVIGPHVPELVPLAEAAGAQVLLLPEETADMRATVERGLRWLEEHCRPLRNDGWLLLPADHPTLNRDVISQILRARTTRPEATILLPTYQGQRGHPAWIGWEHVAAIQAFPVGSGLNSYLRQHVSETLELAVDAPDVLWDLDTPADLMRLGALCSLKE
jgi:molybdenum cofactor cytidylyltransferase